MPLPPDIAEALPAAVQAVIDAQPKVLDFPVAVAGSPMAVAGCLGHMGNQLIDSNGQMVSLATATDRLYPPVDQKIRDLEIQMSLRQAEIQDLRREYDALATQHKALMEQFEHLRDFLIGLPNTPVGTGFRIGWWEAGEWVCGCHYRHKPGVNICTVCGDLRPATPRRT